MTDDVPPTGVDVVAFPETDDLQLGAAPVVAADPCALGGLPPAPAGTTVPPSQERRYVLAVGGVVFLAYVLRVFDLASPAFKVFDENHYVPAAMAYLCGQVDPNGFHPPLGKLLIAAFMEIWWFVERFLLGSWRADAPSPIAWRLGSLVCGLAMIPLTCAFGLRLFGSRKAAVFAGLFLAMDFLHIVQSRLGMLDMYEALFVLAGLHFTWRYIIAEDRPTRLAVLASLAYGLGAVVKWSALFAALAGLLGVLLLKDDAGGWWVRLLATLRLALLGLVLTATLYCASFIPLYFSLGRDLGLTVEQVKTNHRAMWDFRHSRKFKQHIMSQWWQWPLVVRPIRYAAWDSPGPDSGLMRTVTRTSWFRDLVGWRASGEDDHWTCSIVGIGSYFVWYFFLIFLVLGVARSVACLARGAREAEPAEKAIAFCVLAYVLQVGMWAFNRGFIFYMLPVTPMISLVVGESLASWWNLRGGRAAIALFVALATLMLVLYYPMLVGFPLPETWMRELLFYRNDMPWGGYM